MNPNNANANKYPQNPNQNRPNGNQKNVINKKYADFEIQTFFNNENNTGLSAKDMQLKGELETITNQYMATFNNINELSRKFAQGNDNMYKVSMIQKDLEQIDFENANEYGNFIGQIYEVSKNASVTNLTYDNYKKNPRDGDEKLKKIIGDFKYDMILAASKNTSQANYNKIRNYVNEKKRNSYYYNNNSNTNNNNNYNQNYGPAPSQNNNNYQNYNNNPNGNNYNYNNYNNGGNYGNNYNNNYNQRNRDNYGNNQYGPSYGNNYNYNNYPGGKINVKFVVNGRSIYHEVNPNDSGEVLYLFAMEEKDDPKIYIANRSYLSQDQLREMKIGDIFAQTEPTLNIY